MRAPTLLWLILLAAALPRCGQEDFTLSLAWEGSLQGVQVGSYRIVIRNREEVIHESGCLTGSPIDGAEVVLEPGQTLSLEFYGYAGMGCSGSPVLVGVRGEILARAGEHQSYYLFLAERGRFSPFPHPDEDTLEQLAKVECTDDSPCRSLHPEGSCQPSEGRCTISYSPFNGAHPRAFHTATTVSDGSILLAGGVSQSEPEQGGVLLLMASSASLSEVYDPHTGLFRDLPLVEDSMDDRLALQSAAFWGLGMVALQGGTQMISLSPQGDRVSELSFPLLCDPTGSQFGPCTVNQAFVIDVDEEDSPERVIERNPLVPGRFLHASLSLAERSGTVIMLVGGRTDTEAFTPDIILCSRSSSGLECQEDETGYRPLSTPRAGLTLTCLQEDPYGGLCEPLSPILALGGQAPGQPLGEMIYAGTTLTMPLEGNRFHHATVSLGQVDDLAPVLLSGGVLREGLFDEESFLESQLLLIPVNDPDSMTEEDRLPLPRLARRALHTATLLLNGLILIAGGLGPGGEILSSAEVVDPEGNVVEELEMALPRFGHTASLITEGPLEGAVLIMGGFTLQGGSPQTTARGEIYLP